ncbi:DUF4136 domain-containing protein [Terriglobus saanensis]|uniref:DUF4136 domain-containing protein n=1 Tax=Terriglobus saanensis (strain ATCC BAA-1853 / DSM 23119 / SP1PR4) TaxID=401053 RepID=E8V297_TERSS|nr:DUF4136 domain-containing protein [Terriglobus saanensis]ADV81230.1 hypothetical protein AciPR4_0395 [Terriglobus saanensis SP1PR4]
MKKIVSLVIAAVFAVSAGAVAQDVRTDYEHSAHFEHYRTFCIVRLHASNQLVEGRLRDALTRDLTQHGLQPAAADGTCDLTVTAIGNVHNQQEYSTFYDGLGGGFGWRGRGWGGAGGQSTTIVEQIPVGTLIVDLFDSQSKQLVFRGTAQSELSKNPDKNTDKLYKAVDKMFKKFPPKQG